MESAIHRRVGNLEAAGGETHLGVEIERDLAHPALIGVQPITQVVGGHKQSPVDKIDFRVALVAPRHALLATADSDSEGDNLFADERNLRASRGAYQLLGAEPALRMRVRPRHRHKRRGAGSGGGAGGRRR